jgi:hypothetical protein
VLRWRVKFSILTTVPICGDSAQGRFIDPSDDLSIIDERLRKF